MPVWWTRGAEIVWPRRVTLSYPKTRRSRHEQDTPHQQLSAPHHLLPLIDKRGFTQEPDTLATEARNVASSTAVTLLRSCAIGGGSREAKDGIACLDTPAGTVLRAGGSRRIDRGNYAMSSHSLFWAAWLLALLSRGTERPALSRNHNVQALVTGKPGASLREPRNGDAVRGWSRRIAPAFCGRSRTGVDGLRNQAHQVE
jgi:hypothetical protein